MPGDENTYHQVTTVPVSHYGYRKDRRASETRLLPTAQAYDLSQIGKRRVHVKPRHVTAKKAKPKPQPEVSAPSLFARLRHKEPEVDAFAERLAKLR